MQNIVLAVRAIVFLLFQLVTVIPVAFGCLLLWPLPLRQRYTFTIYWPKMVLWAARVLLGITWEVRGTEHLPAGKAIVLSKHQSTWETLFIASYLPKQMCFVFKRELMWIPFFGWGIGLLRMMAINRSRGSEAFENLVKQAHTQFDVYQRWVVFFPEGTRIPAGRMGKYKTGGARLAISTNTPIVPIAHNAGEVWPRNAFLKHPGKVTVVIGPTIDPTGLTSEQLTSKVQDWIETQMRELSPHRYDQPYTPAFKTSTDSPDNMPVAVQRNTPQVEHVT